MLHSKPPQTLVAENNSNFIIRHNSVSELELSRVIISAGLIRGISCCCSQIVGGLKHPRWIHSDFSLEGDAEAGCWGSQASLFPLCDLRVFISPCDLSTKCLHQHNRTSYMFACAPKCIKAEAATSRPKTGRVLLLPLSTESQDQPRFSVGGDYAEA